VITEPMTLLTDWLLAGLCLAFATRLWRRGVVAGSRSMRVLAASFAATAVGAFAGGAAHGFRPYLSATGDLLLWKITVLAIGLTTLMFVVSAACAALTRVSRRLLIGAAVLQAVVYSAWMLRHDEFIWVIADYVPAMVVVLGLQGLQWRRGEPSATWIAGGLLVSFVGAAIQASGLAPHPYFNHNDLYHVVQMGATWMLFRGGLLLRDRR